jgi:predicted DNA repair protein MutK
LGTFLIKALPVIIKILAVVGTLALIFVSGGIFVHNIDFLHHMLPSLPDLIKEFLAGLVAGLVMVALYTVGKAIYKAVAGKKQA